MLSKRQFLLKAERRQLFHLGKPLCVAFRREDRTASRRKNLLRKLILLVGILRLIMPIYLITYWFLTRKY
ncbi:hypothetical protein COO91_00328 [Nostoc flagelliforme CCNUN1]|uniref:Uncharacterized protein n=1 Tax=Nostoc flagelliforme CCNUN1 TaxID=2038116 RepID=A0A2K8SI25_9NOSO|nr:hypothetical protein COO91_00328 [Nostoc flagelliforme CCNUN1]